jgi:plasmid stabilization system protein ParE
MASITWSPRASRDYEAICLELERYSQRAVESFTSELSAALDRLALFPRMGRMVPEYGRDDVREVFVMRYRVMHQVVDDSVEILMIQHGSRRLRDFSPP